MEILFEILPHDVYEQLNKADNCKRLMIEKAISEKPKTDKTSSSDKTVLKKKKNKTKHKTIPSVSEQKQSKNFLSKLDWLFDTARYLVEFIPEEVKSQIQEQISVPIICILPVLKYILRALFLKK